MGFCVDSMAWMAINRPDSLDDGRSPVPVPALGLGVPCPPRPGLRDPGLAGDHRSTPLVSGLSRSRRELCHARE